MRKLLVAVPALAVSAALASQALAATSVKVADDYFVRSGSTPAVTVKRGTKVTWRWSGRGLHNVAVQSGPVRFNSSLKRSGTYSKTVRTAGTYTIVCTVHQPEMTMKLRVRR